MEFSHCLFKELQALEVFIWLLIVFAESFDKLFPRETYCLEDLYTNQK